jgi:hypothetical protein
VLVIKALLAFYPPKSPLDKAGGFSTRKRKEAKKSSISSKLPKKATQT